MGEPNFDSLLRGEFLAERSYARHQAQPLQSGGMQTMGEGVKISTQFAGRVEQLVQLLASLPLEIACTISAAFSRPMDSNASL